MYSFKSILVTGYMVWSLDSLTFSCLYSVTKHDKIHRRSGFGKSCGWCAYLCVSVCACAHAYKNVEVWLV